MVFDDNGGVPGNLLYEEEAIADNGWATIYPNLTGLSGSFYVIASHSADWTDYEGFGVDAGVDYPNNMVTYQYGMWNYGDYLGYGGDYMIASQVFAYGEIQTISYSDNTPTIFDGERTNIALSTNQLESSLISSVESNPEYDMLNSRDLQSFDIFRDEFN